MPIARFQLEDGRVARFEVPEGTTPEQAQAMMQAQVSQGLGQQQQPSSGYPSEVDSPETAQQYMEAVESAPGQPQGPQPQQETNPFAAQQAQVQGRGQGMEALGNTALEFISALNRGLVELADMPAELANMASSAMGGEKIAATIGDIPAIQAGTKGEFMPEGRARQAVGMLGEFMAPAPPIGALLKAKQTAGLAPSVSDEAMAAMDDAAKYAGGDVPFMPARPAPEITPVIKSAMSEASKQGIGDDVIELVNTASQGTKRKMAAISKITSKGMKDPRYKAKYSPWKIPGDALAERVDALGKIKAKAGNDLSKAVESLSGNINYGGVRDEFMDSLSKNHGVKFDYDDMGNVVPDFVGSVFEKSAKPRSLIKNILTRFDGGATAGQAHIDKKYVDELVNWTKDNRGSAGQVESVAQQLRGKVNGLIGEVSPAYKAANATYSESIDVLDKIGKAAGVKVDVESPQYGAAVGTGLRRMLGHSQKKAPLTEAVDLLESVTAKHGKTFNDDVADLVQFADMNDALYRTSGGTSLGGELSKVADRSIDAAAGTQTLTGLAAEGAKAGWRAARGVNEANSVKALDQLIKSGIKSGIK